MRYAILAAAAAVAILAAVSFGAKSAEACLLDDRSSFGDYPCWARQAFTNGTLGGDGGGAGSGE